MNIRGRRMNAEEKRREEMEKEEGGAFL